MNDDVPFQSLHPSSLPFNRLMGGIVAAVIELPLIVVFALYAWTAGWADIGTRVGLLIGLIVALVLFFAAWVFPAWAYRAASWRVSEIGLEIRRGVWWKHQVVIPHSRMQHSDIEQGPVQRWFELATLVIHTAGTKDSSVKLEGLSSETAERLRESLVSHDISMPEAASTSDDAEQRREPSLLTAEPLSDVDD